MSLDPSTSLRQIEPLDLATLRIWLCDVGLPVPALEPETWADRLRADPRIVSRTAWRGAERIGFARLDLAPDRSAEVTVIVSPDHRRRGHGGQLLEWSLEEARRRHLRKVVALVRHGKSGALAFFLDAGFEPTGMHVPGFVQLARFVHRAAHQPPLEISP